MFRQLAFAWLAVPLLAASAPAQQSASFSLTSPDIKEGAKITDVHVFNQMGCTGQNTSPELDWKGAPPATKSFALTLYDPDAPTGSGFWHWVVYNIPASANKLPAGAGDPAKNLVPQGAVQGNTDLAKPGYLGPCPPPGDKAHRYQFTLFALDTDKIDVPAGSTAAFVGFNLHAHTLATAKLNAIYSR